MVVGGADPPDGVVTSSRISRQAGHAGVAEVTVTTGAARRETEQVLDAPALTAARSVGGGDRSGHSEPRRTGDDRGGERGTMVPAHCSSETPPPSGCRSEVHRRVPTCSPTGGARFARTMCYGTSPWAAIATAHPNAATTEPAASARLAPVDSRASGALAAMATGKHSAL